MWLARKAISPSTERQTIISAWPEKSVRVGVTSSNWVVATDGSGLALQRAGLLVDAVDTADVEERLLGDIVEVAIDKGLERLHRLCDRHVYARDAGEGLGHVERL